MEKYFEIYFFQCLKFQQFLGAGNVTKEQQKALYRLSFFIFEMEQNFFLKNSWNVLFLFIVWRANKRFFEVVTKTIFPVWLSQKICVKNTRTKKFKQESKTSFMHINIFLSYDLYYVKRSWGFLKQSLKVNNKLSTFSSNFDLHLFQVYFLKSNLHLII